MIFLSYNKIKNTSKRLRKVYYKLVLKVYDETHKGIIWIVCHWRLIFQKGNLYYEKMSTKTGSVNKNNAICPFLRYQWYVSLVKKLIIPGVW